MSGDPPVFTSTLLGVCALSSPITVRSSAPTVGEFFVVLEGFVGTELIGIEDFR